MPKTKWAPIPKSKATNVYDLLQDVYKAIEEEPTRFRMDSFISVEQGDICPIYLPEEFEGHMPACGTVGCSAGWTNLLVPITSSYSVQLQAHKLVEFAKDNKEDEIESLLLDLFYNEAPFDKYDYGTPQYTKVALKTLASFLKKHKKILLACPISNPNVGA